MPEVVESRRLTGANIHARAAGAVIELRFAPEEDPEPILDAWRSVLGEGLTALGWSAAELHIRRFVDPAGRTGAELMFTAPVDQLYAATELNEWALDFALAQLDPASVAEGLLAVSRAAAEERGARRGALELLAAADAHGLIGLIDDDELSIGQYANARVWPVAALPSVDEVDWASFRRRPIALITGTNGKTTTTRLLARMLRHHGLHVGNSSTDGMYVDERLIDAGDWTGPGGARTMLRNPDIEVALLEAARGGLLRRGVGVPHADVAVITNITADHLGEYGVFDLAGMAAAKGIVANVVDPGGRVVLGAESPALVDWAAGHELPAPVVWFALDPDHRVVKTCEAEVWTIVDEHVVRREAGRSTALCRVDAMPLSLGGRAKHNVANALAAAAAARGLGVADEAIAAALREFGGAPEDNPGRARIWAVPTGSGRTTRVFLDFAHNLAGIAAIVDLVASMFGPVEPAVCFGMAGDRSDDELRGLGAALTQFEPRVVVLREQPHYMRGRTVGEVPGLLAQGLVGAGFDSAKIVHAQTEPASIERAIELGADLVIVLVHTEHEAVAEWLRVRGAQFEPGG